MNKRSDIFLSYPPGRRKLILIIDLILILLIILLFSLTCIINFNCENNPDKEYKAYGLIIDKWARIIYKLDEEFYDDYMKPIEENCNDDLCIVRNLYSNLSTFEYEIGTDLNPKYIIQNHSADCDEFTITILTLLQKYDFKKQAKCTYNHCFAELEIDDRRIRFDVAMDIYLEKEIL